MALNPQNDETPLDPRRHAFRPDLAAESLRGRVEAARFSPPKPMRVTAASAPMRARPDTAAAYASEMLHGEIFDCYDVAQGWAWGQVRRDGYVGYLAEENLSPPGQAPTHRVRDLRAFLYGAPNIKTPPLGFLPYGAHITVSAIDGKFAQSGGLYLYAAHLSPLAERADDPVAEAGRFLGIPYLWGGKTSLGLDCSGLVQLACQACGIEAPRDSDMQERELGEAVGMPDDVSGLARGHLLFWPGHVALVEGGGRMLHANAFHMQVVSEAIAPALARIAASGSALRSIRRLV